jgi:ubiquinone/menaquinone biosynthesis C-methylase UbiE
MNNLAPIVLFVYNRPTHTRKCLESLTKNDLSDESELFIYADGYKDGICGDQLHEIKKVRSIIKEKQWCRKVHIIERKTNIGLANSIIQGVTEIVNLYGKIIVLEDDLILSVGFLKYMNDALDMYQYEDKVMHVSGYIYPFKSILPETFFYRTTTCWGWGTWNTSWKEFNHNAEELLMLVEKGRVREFNLNNVYDYYSLLKRNKVYINDSWAIRWYASVFLQNGLALHPKISLVRNIGFDDSGIHCNEDKTYTEQNIIDYIQVRKIDLRESDDAKKAIKLYFKPRSLTIKELFKKVILYKYITKQKNRALIPFNKKNRTNDYWKKNIQLLESWGKDHVWNEIQMLTVNCKGRVLDIACGTGVVMKVLSMHNKFELYGCDIAESVINKCIERGIDKKHLKVCDASEKMPYEDGFFDYAYSIGSIEYFTESELLRFIEENYRITKGLSFHMLPVSMKQVNEGYIDYMGSKFFNNSEEWWYEKFKSKFKSIEVIDSGWKNDISIGKWFVCIK